MGMVFLSENACEALIDDLRNEGHELFLVRSTDLVYDAVAAHPDIYMCIVGDTLVIDDAVKTDPDLRQIYDRMMAEKLGDASDHPLLPARRTAAEGSIVFQTGGIGHDYPDDTAYDAVSTGRYFIHNLEYTSPLLKDRAREAGLEFIHVKQGYTRCSCVVAGDQALITSDRGILRTLDRYNQMLEEEGLEAECIDCLEIQEGHVELPGLNHGFLGGTSGIVGKTLYFNGNLSAHPDADRIVDFVRKHGLEPVWYPEIPLMDIGSIIYFE